MGASVSRQLAFQILYRVESQQSFADELLHSTRLNSLSARDRGLAFQLVLGVLRWRGALDALIRAYSKRPLPKLDLEVLTSLRLGAFQIHRMERVPARAAVSESVELVRAAGKRSAAGMVNAILRRIADDKNAQLQPEAAYPPWLIQRWQANLGRQAAQTVINTEVQEPPTYLRLTASLPLPEVLARLDSEGLETEPTELSLCRRLLRGSPQATALWRAGKIRIQDLSSQMAATLLEAKPEHRVLDLCAAPGGKTQQIIDVRNTPAGVVAADLHPHRLRRLGDLAPYPIARVVLDAQRQLPFRASFHRILVDAPCSGTGTLARNPDIKWRLRPEDLGQLQGRQLKILRHALERLIPGGLLVYATCSLEPEENEEVVARALESHHGLRRGESFTRIPGRDAGDGFFACQILKKAEGLPPA